MSENKTILKKPVGNNNEKERTINPFKAESLGQFLQATGYNANIESLQESMKALKHQTTYGEVDLLTYEGLVKAKIYEYIKFGIARRVWQMMVEKDRGIKEGDVMLILLEMARMEIDYGLRPIIHVIPVDNQIYVKADGFLYYARNSGKLKTIKWEDKQEDDGWTSKCIVETDTGTYEGIASAKPNPKVYSDDPREKARTKAMRRALRRAFPIGASDEIFDEFENKPIYPNVETVEKPAEDIRELLKETTISPNE